MDCFAGDIRCRFVSGLCPLVISSRNDGRFNKGSASYDPGYVSTGEGGIRSSCIHDFVIGGISRSCS